MGILLLGLGLLTLLNFPLETATAHKDAKNDKARPTTRDGGDGNGPHPDHDPARHIPWTRINWIRIYKNPKTTPASELTKYDKAYVTPPRYLYNFADKDFDKRNTYLQPSLASEGHWTHGQGFWVDFDPISGELPDPGPDGGRVTATENTVVRVGEKVAIAINVDNENGAQINAAIGLGTSTSTAQITHQREFWVEIGNTNTYQRKRRDQLQDSQLSGVLWANHLDSIPEVTTFTRSIDIEWTWELRPNMPLYNFALWPGGAGWPPGENAPAKFDTVSATGTQKAGANHTLVYHFEVTSEHLQLNEGEWLKKGTYAPDAVAPFNVLVPFAPGDYRNNGRGFSEYNPAKVLAPSTHSRSSHIDLDPPVFDATADPIYYPRLVERVGATPEIDPLGTQTGAFMVTLRFQEDYDGIKLPVSHDTSEDILATLQTALAAGVEHGTVTQIERQAAAGTYQVTLVPVLGFKGEMTLQVPAETVSAVVSGLGNKAAILRVPVDTPLPPVEAQSEVVAPESGTYLAGNELTVEVSFATDGLTYEGENPPYVTIYLGAEEPANARHAVWQKGSERSGSTIVPFVYTVHTEDPIVSSVSVAIDSSDSLNSLSIPRETTLTAASGLMHFGTAEPAAAAGQPVEDASVPGPSTDLPTFEVQVLPVIYIPPDASDPKADASSVPRSPIVFNELGNGSGDTDDWLELRNVTDSDVSLKDWELSVVADGKKEDTSLIAFSDVSVPANGLLLITNMPADKTPLAGGANKGLSHALLVDAGLSLPDDGKFLLILRNAKEKLGLNEAFIDVAGGGGSDTDAFVREQTGDYDTHVWPLQVREAPGGDTEDALGAGKVWARAKADIVGYHKEAWGEAVFTGLGYDRKVSKSAATAGTPGYPNGAVKTEASTPQGAVTFSELMFDTAGATLPQWIELYNNSKTEALNLNRWKLEIQNRRSEDLVGRPIVTLTLQEKVIQPNQTLLIVAGDARASSENVFPADRVYNLLKLHEKNLRIKKPQDAFLSAEGFYLKLSDRNGTKIDEIGNLDDNRRTDDAPLWVMPVSGMEDARSSLVRRYTKGVAEDGMERAGWAVAAHFKQFKVADLHYGHADDIGTPGYRQGGALPVELSSFTVSRTEAGAVVVTWTTESEVDNAGFNLRRSEKRESGFTLLNPTLIAGAGTTGERQTYTFTDTSAKPGVEYYYQIEEVSFAGKREMLVTRRLAGPVSPANRALTTFGEVKQAK